MSLTQKEINALIVAAKRGRTCSFAHRSNHCIGASVLTEEGEVYAGCNIESLISGLGSCAERTAIDHAIVHGRTHFRAICTVDEKLTPTCGACLQYLLLFSQLTGKDIVMINADMHAHYEVTTLSMLLPHGFKATRALPHIRAFAKKRKKNVRRL